VEIGEAGLALMLLGRLLRVGPLPPVGCAPLEPGLAVVPCVVGPVGVAEGDPIPLPERPGKVPGPGPNGDKGAVDPVAGAGDIAGKTPGVTWNGFDGVLLVGTPCADVGDAELPAGDGVVVGPVGAFSGGGLKGGSTCPVDSPLVCAFVCCGGAVVAISRPMQTRRTSKFRRVMAGE
jgi:hypothetical protein